MTNSNQGGIAMRKVMVLILVTLMSLFVVACGGGSHKTQAGFHTKFGLSAHSPTFGLPPKGITLPRASTAPTKLMLDTTSLGSLSGLRIEVAAGYTSGHWPTFTQMVGKYRYVVAVMVYQTHFGVKGHRSCLDREPGDAPTSAVGPWARHEISIGIVPCVYTSLSWMPAVKSALAAALGSNWRARVFLWDADWTFVAHLDLGYDATQWTDHYLNRNVDGSQVTYRFAGISTHHNPVRLICFGKSARPHNATCKKVIAQVNKWDRAAASSQRVYVSGGCPVLAQRIGWFSHAIRTHPSSPRTASRRRALAASRHAYRKHSCGVFAQRFNFFTKKATAERKAFS